MRVDYNAPYSSLAYANRINRAPFEVVHVVGLKDGRVVVHQAFTSGEANRVQYNSPEQVKAMEDVAEAYDRGDIDEWVTMHNHPGGRPEPSPTDVENVGGLSAAMGARGYRGDVVTDHREYGYVAPGPEGMETSYQRFDTEIQRKLSPDDPLFVGQKTGLSDQRNLTEVVAYHKKNTEGKDVASLFYTNNQGVVRGVQLISVDNLRDARWIRRHIEQSKASVMPAGSVGTSSSPRHASVVGSSPWSTSPSVTSLGSNTTV
jgi:hypothetical protein